MNAPTLPTDLRRLALTIAVRRLPRPLGGKADVVSAGA